MRCSRGSSMTVCRRSAPKRGALKKSQPQQAAVQGGRRWVGGAHGREDGVGLLLERLHAIADGVGLQEYEYHRLPGRVNCLRSAIVSSV